MTTEETLREVGELQARCEQYEGITLKLNWDMLRDEGTYADTEWFVTYEDELLVGFIGLYGFGHSAEICGMVRPGYRRRGIFTSLWKRAAGALQRLGIGEVLLNAPAGSASAAGFLKTLPVRFHHAEYQMAWSGSVHTEADTETAGPVTLRPARQDEAGRLAELDRIGFGMSEADTEDLYGRLLSRTDEEHIVIEYDNVPCGKLRLATDNRETWIYGFVVEPEWRGRGIGRTVLLQTIERERLNGNGIFLEVALENPRALKLYESCGFVVSNRQDYYRLTAS